MIKNDHMAFQVTNIDESIEFYTKVLGLELEFKDENLPEKEKYAFLHLDGGKLEILERIGEKYEKPIIKPPFCPHLALETKNIEETLEMIKNKGLRIIKGPLEVPREVKWLYISDPDNNIIEYIEWISRNKK
jgi:catechol 2,3-dioxygenase-like lactoylglutathione lyase family enzyme